MTQSKTHRDSSERSPVATPNVPNVATSPKNNTYERALEMFFQDGPSQDQQSQLPQEVDGLSVRRQAMIEAVYQAEHETERLHALRMLYAHFGLPHNVRVISLALTSEDEPLALEALRALEAWLTAQLEMGESGLETLEMWRAQLESRLEHLILRSFNDLIQSETARCQSMLRRALSTQAPN